MFYIKMQRFKGSQMLDAVVTCDERFKVPVYTLMRTGHSGEQ